jgi:hypothetical protein
MIDLGFDARGDLVSIDATQNWNANYYFHGSYEVTTEWTPGIYNVVAMSGLQPGFQTGISLTGLDNLTLRPGLDAFNPVATPEPSTLFMLAMGFTAILFMSSKRARRQSQRIDAY